MRLAVRSLRHAAHLLVGIQWAAVVTALEFGNIPGKVLDAHVVVDAYISPLEHSPMGLYAVGVRHALDVLFGRMLDGLVRAIQSVIGRRLVGVDLGRGFRLGLHETLKRGRIGGLHGGRGYLARLPVLDADNRRLADCPAPRSELLTGVLVLFLAPRCRSRPLQPGQRTCPPLRPTFPVSDAPCTTRSFGLYPGRGGASCLIRP